MEFDKFTCKQDEVHFFIYFIQILYVIKSKKVFNLNNSRVINYIMLKSNKQFKSMSYLFYYVSWGVEHNDDYVSFTMLLVKPTTDTLGPACWTVCVS